MTFESIVTAVLLLLAPPGNTKYSVTPQNCHGEACESGTWSEYYDAFVHRETKDEGADRYQVIGDKLTTAAMLELCRDTSGNRIQDCVANPESKGWSVANLVWSSVGLLIPESGVREDVQMGRGRSGHPYEGGEGRGPSMEACLMQVHPSTLWRFVPDLVPQERGQYGSSPQSREMLARSLLGQDGQAQIRCYRTGMRMLMHAKRYCDWDRKLRAKRLGIDGAIQGDPYFEMYSLYGTGNSCMAANGTKTSYRVAVRNRAIKVAARFAP